MTTAVSPPTGGARFFGALLHLGLHARLWRGYGFEYF